MKSSVTFLKSLLTNSFMLGNGFLSMFGCVCLYIWKWEYFLLVKIPKRSACLLLFTPVLSWFVRWWVQRHFIASMGSCLVASLLASYDCPGTDHLRACYTPKPKIQLMGNGINAMAFAEAFHWHWRAVTLQSCTKVVRNLHLLLLFPGYQKVRKGPTWMVFFVINFQWEWDHTLIDERSCEISRHR